MALRDKMVKALELCAGEEIYMSTTGPAFHYPAARDFIETLIAMLTPDELGVFINEWVSETKNFDRAVSAQLIATVKSANYMFDITQEVAEGILKHFNGEVREMLASKPEPESYDTCEAGGLPPYVHRGGAK